MTPLETVLAQALADSQSLAANYRAQIAALRAQLAEKQEPTGPTEAPASPAGALGTEAAT